MRVPTIDRGPGAASPWGRPRPAEEAIRLVPLAAPLAGLVVRGTLLTLLTLGVYRFWYRTQLRRYYWSNTTLLGDGFEYTGTGRELLVGFLIMLAIFLPANFVVSILGIFAGEGVGGAVSAVVLALILPALTQIVIYRARAYRLNRTRYRGIRFHQSGTGRGFLLTTAKWLLLTALTLGITLPYLREAMNRYKVEHTHFGSLKADCGSSPKVLMKRWLAVWGMLMLALALTGAIGLSLMSGADIGLIVVEGVLLGLAVALLPILWQIYRVHEFRHFVSTTRFGDLTLGSDASAASVIWITGKFVLTVFGFGFVLTGIAALVGGAGALTGLDDDADAVAALPGLLLLSFVALIGYGLIVEIYLRRKLWLHYAGSIALTNTGQLAAIIQSEGQQGSALGDSFDPGFDIAG